MDWAHIVFGIVALVLWLRTERLNDRAKFLAETQTKVWRQLRPVKTSCIYPEHADAWCVGPDGDDGWCVVCDG